MELSPVSDMHFYNCENTKYKEHLTASINAVTPLLTNKQKRALINHKLQFKRHGFDINQYIQSACELSVISRMYVDFINGFEYEPKRNVKDVEHKNKDVDFSFEYESLRLNVEVKCFNRRTTESSISDSEQENVRIKSRFLPLKDFFIKSNEKFGYQGEFEANVLFVCCYDLADFIDVSNSLAGQSGVCFRKNSPDENKDCVLDVADFEKIDVVIVSNVAFHHENFNRSNDGHFLNPWDFLDTFVMGFQVHDKRQDGLKQLIDQLIKQSFNIQNDRYTIFCDEQGLDKFDYDVSLRKLIDHMNCDLGGYYFVSENPTLNP
ncbi:Putative uncharacterized protein [Moritella viscosa]|uniref:hypothetical protein n=1 Tax=Moritella viscosa TaxID=80854 RepID=UPI000508F8FF|nr:hypothetical protein [Moritella viscosa]CED59743.1 putative uncharacterized protein [Moritella viscosa]SHO02188.1 Putative uncharacterized protein [Moritella viscosa]SHO02351.1 Putative uncharacterized protein [Moritella viscosa]SHO03056.1 Putative uncharacterized protein [Moritella viscosa]SHO04441.1 Putative uncharacterized protein [Moritella viscosa]